MNSSLLLEIIVPAYKRPLELLACVQSIALQATPVLAESVGIAVCDDASGVFPEHQVLEILRNSPLKSIRVSENAHNKGMSRNIYDLFRTSAAKYVSVLSDDDQLLPGALECLVETLQRSSSCTDEGAVFFPRSCYSDSGQFLFTVCQPFNALTVIKPSPLAALRYCHNGFILTGLILRRDCIDFLLWREHMENSFFPVLALSAVLRRFAVRFVDADLFQHTVDNVVHWERWGATECVRSFRLFSDYIVVLELVAAASVRDYVRMRDIGSILKLTVVLIRCMRKQYSYQMHLPRYQLVLHSLSGGVWLPCRLIAFLLALQAHWRMRFRSSFAKVL